ncbi:hypothetical protein ACX6XY_23605 [Streptomyces sp. O3]
MPTEPKNDRQKAPRGWRMDPIPSRPAYKDDAGNVRVPVWLTKNGRHVADTEMVLLPSEAELLRDNLADALGDVRSVLRGALRGSALVFGAGVTVVPKDGPSWL